MFKKVKNWRMSIMIGVVSLLSLLVIQQYVMAAWQDPTSLPGDSDVGGIVLNPMTTNLDLQGNTVIDSTLNSPESTQPAVMSINNDCSSGCRYETAAFYGETDSSGNYAFKGVNWQGEAAAYFEGKVGIGQAAHPLHLLDIVSSDVGNNAEINIQSGLSNDYWAIYHDGPASGDTDDLRFWNEDFGSDVLTLDTAGNVEINNGYLKIDSANTAPAAADCNTVDEVGRMVLDYQTHRLYVCTGSALGISWRFAALSAAGF